MKLFLLTIVATAVCALPNADYPDSVVPETGLVDTTAFEPAKEAQEAITVLLQEGKDEGACAALAAEIVEEVQNGVNVQQQILDSLDNGSDCHNQGQAGVDAAQKSLDSATSALSDASKALTDANNAPVTVGAAFSTLTEGQCDFFFSDAAYTTVKATFETAKTEVQKAQGAKNGAVTALDAAKAAQKAAVEQCFCDVRSAYNKAWKASNANNDENEKAYAKGKHMACVLAGTAPADCDVSEVPKVTAITLADGVPEHMCVSFGPKIFPKLTGCSPFRGKKNEFLDRQNVKCEGRGRPKGLAMTGFKVMDWGCKDKGGGGYMRYRTECMVANYGSLTTYTKKTGCTSERGLDTWRLKGLSVSCWEPGNIPGLLQSFQLEDCGYEDHHRKNFMRYTYTCLRPEIPLTHRRSLYSSCEEGRGKTLEYLDRLKVACPAGTALNGFQMEHGTQRTQTCDPGQYRYKFTCIK